MASPTQSRPPSPELFFETLNAYHTFSEYERMFRNAGFSSSELHPLPPTYHQVVIPHR